MDPFEREASYQKHLHRIDAIVASNRNKAKSHHMATSLSHSRAHGLGVVE